MKTKIISMILVATLLMPTTAVFADTNVAYSNENRQANEQLITLNSINYTIIENETNVIVRGTDGGNTTVDKATGEIVTELNGVITRSNVNDYITETNNNVNDYIGENSLKTRSMPMALGSNYQYGNEFTDDYLYQDWFQDGYKYLEGHHSRDYNKNGFLFKRDGGATIYKGNRFTFSKGTAVGTVLGALVTILTGGTAAGVLASLGISGVGVLVDYFDIKVDFQDDKYLYRVRDDNAKILLDTYQVKRYVLTHDYVKNVDIKTFDRMNGGFAGTTSDMIEAGLSLYY